MNNTKNTGGPAFPVEGCWDENGNFHGAQTGNARGWAEGMTLRDYFAAKAIQALITKGADILHAERVSNAAYIWADAMLKAREQ